MKMKWRAVSGESGISATGGEARERQGGILGGKRGRREREKTREGERARTSYIPLSGGGRREKPRQSLVLNKFIIPELDRGRISEAAGQGRSGYRSRCSLTGRSFPDT